MLRTSWLRVALATAAALTFAACTDDTPSPTAANPVLPSVANVQSSSQGSELPSADELDQQVPGFGGFFLDRDGVPAIYLSRGSSRAPAERALGRYLAGRGLSNAALSVLEGRYGWM